MPFLLLFWIRIRRRRLPTLGNCCAPLVVLMSCLKRPHLSAQLFVSCSGSAAAATSLSRSLRGIIHDVRTRIVDQGSSSGRAANTCRSDRLRGLQGVGLGIVMPLGIGIPLGIGVPLGMGIIGI